jgi:hypothetical protein
LAGILLRREAPSFIFRYEKCRQNFAKLDKKQKRIVEIGRLPLIEDGMENRRFSQEIMRG